MPHSTVETTASEKEESITQQAKDCLEKFQDRESDNINRAEEAIRFRAGEQWPQQIRRDREDEHQDGGPRPCPVLDKTDQYVRQIVNEERLNRAAIKIRPVDDHADPKTAEIFTGIIRHIEDASEALVAYTTAGEHAIDGGFGYFRVLAEYTDDMSFSQDIRIKRIHNRFSVALGPHTEPDGADAKEALVWEDMSRKDFKAEFPNAKEIGFESSDDWQDKDSIRIAEYFKIVQEPQTIHQLETGEVFTDEDYKKLIEAVQAEGMEVPEPVETRETTVSKVKWYKLNADEILEEKDLAGSYIPIIKVTGNEITMPDGKIRLSGAVESAMDAQRLHNYAHAGFIEHIALAPRAPWVAEEDQIKGYEGEYADANRKPIAVLKYKNVSVDGHLLPPPQRTPPPGMSTGWQQIMQNTEHGIEASFGMYGPSVGAQSQEKSGIALQEQKAQGAVGQFHFPDNLARSIQHCGRILLEWIPVYMDTAEIARILGEDGEQEIVKLNPDQEQAMMPEYDEFEREVGQIYNLTVGKYDVTVSTGPSYTAKRQEAVDTQTAIIQAAPDLMGIMGDILFSNMDAPGSDKIAERLKATLPPEIQQLEQQDGQVDPKVQAMMAQIEQMSQEIEQRGQELQQFEQEINTAAQEAGADKTAVEAQRKELESARKVFFAEVKAEEAEMQVKAREIKDEIDSALGDANKEDDIKIILKYIEEDAKNNRHDREMDLKEVEAGVKSAPREDAICDALGVMGDQLEHISESTNKPRPFPVIERDENNDVISINGRPVKRDDRGNMIGFQDEEGDK